MPELLVVNPGLLTSVQDTGRFGFRRFGVPWSGALDPSAAQLANALLDNPLESAVLEFFQQGPTLRLPEGRVRLAVIGDCLLTLHRGNQRQMFRAGRSVDIEAGDTLHIGRVHAGKVGYVAVGGEIDVPAVMGSCSTYLRAGFGGLDGDLLQAGSHLTLLDAGKRIGPNLFLPTQDAGHEPSEQLPPRTIRVIMGPQDDYFTASAKETLQSEVYRISHDSDRMGSRLVGPHLEHDPEKGAEIISDGLIPGTIQVPGSGAPIVLLADGPTVGGYPKIATVISSDLPVLATMMPGTPLRFEAVTVEEGEAALRDCRAAHQRRLESIQPLPNIAEPFADVPGRG